MRETDQITQTLLAHKENRNMPAVPAKKVGRRILLDMCKDLLADECLALRSRTKSLGSEECLFPLIDMSLPIGDLHRVNLLTGLLKQIHDLHLYEGYGFLLESTRSYHYYGSCPLPKHDWYAFLGRFLLLHPKNEDCEVAIRLNLSTIVDARFIGHALVAGQGSLRISAGPNGDLRRL